MTKKRLYIALAVYAVLAAIGAVATSGEVRIVLWIFLAGLAIKSYIALVREKI